MAAESSFTQMLFFIASILVAVSISGVIIGISGSMAQEIQTKANNASSEMGTSILFVNDPRYVPYHDGNLTLYLKNIGDITLYNYNMLIFIDGEYIDHSVQVVGTNSTAWTPGNTIEIHAEIVLQPGDHSAKAITANGVSDTMDFRL